MASSSAREAAIAARAAGPGLLPRAGAHRGVPDAVLVGGDLAGHVAAGPGEHPAKPPGQHAGQVPVRLLRVSNWAARHRRRFARIRDSFWSRRELTWASAPFLEKGHFR